MLNRERQLALIAEPHTASRATRFALEATEGWEYVKPHHCDLAKLKDKHGVTDAWTLLCTVRNPFDVLITKWRHSNNQFNTLDCYLTANRDKPEIDLPLRGLWRDAHLFLYYEHLNEDWEWFFPEAAQIEHHAHHVTRDKQPWQSYYKDIPNWVEYLLDKWKSFLENFGYQIDPASLECTFNVEQRFIKRGALAQ